jgi:hypothetical protein
MTQEEDAVKDALGLPSTAIWYAPAALANFPSL